MMQSKLRSIFFVPFAAILLGACHSMPNHARYIPKDAVAVVGLNVKSLGKKIAWNVITGSKLFDEMQKRLKDKTARDAVSGIEKAGIDGSNTFYVYVKTDNRFKGGNRITGLVPLEDAAKWEAYVKQTFPKVEIKQQGDRKEASLGSDMYVGWTKDLLIIINVMSTSQRDRMPEIVQPEADITDKKGEAVTEPAQQSTQVSSAMDKVDLHAEMDNAFQVSEANSVLKDEHFTKLEKENHDISFLLNYDQLMTQYSADMAERTGVALSGSLWKNAVFTSGFDFLKGKITGDMRYYMSPEMKEIGKEFARLDADKDMIARLPNQNLDMVLSMHISPKATKDMLEKAGLLGIANVTLANSGLTADNIFDAFTGDMAIVMNDFSLKTETMVDSFLGEAVTHKTQKANIAMSYVMKINKKENFQQLLKMATDNGLQRSATGYVIPMTDKDSVHVLVNDQYIVASNRYANAAGFMGGSFKSKKMPPAASAAVNGHPWALFFDVQQMFKELDPGISSSARDSAMIMESKRLLSNISISGGEYKDNSFVAHMEVNFVNTSENSILQLLDYGMRINEAGKIAQAR
jgi:hypothetical protein